MPPWQVAVRQQLRQFQRFAKMNLAMNTLASLYYSRLYNFGLIVVTVLTVVVGSKGVANLVNSPLTAVNIILSCCDVALGVTAALLTGLELKGKAERYHRRACGYSLMSSQLQIDICVDEQDEHSELDRQRLRAVLSTLPERLSELEQHADPLPLRYRVQAQTMPHTLFYTNEDDAMEPTAAQSAIATAHYAEGHEHEGSGSWSGRYSTAAPSLIMAQAI